MMQGWTMNELKDMDNGIVSVIIPVYQAEKYLSRCISSVLNQTYKNLEILLIDDGSTDKSLHICKEMAQTDLRIRVFHHENAGVAATRNLGLDEAKGEFIYFLDSDDRIDSNTLSAMVLSMTEHHAQLCICGFQYVEETGCKKHGFPTDCKVDKSEFMDQYFWDLYENSVLFNIGTKLYRRSIIEEAGLRFHTDMVVYEDIRFCLEYVDKVQQIYLQGKPYYDYLMDNSESLLHGYKSGFWESTFKYCHILMSKFANKPSSLNKAVLLCLYRAYLQECHNPELKKREFCRLLKQYCFPVEKSLKRMECGRLKLSIDQKIFRKLVSYQSVTLLWLLALVISMKGR